jgi:hypothetical protein
VRIVVPAVDYADFLAVTLPAWQAMFPFASITVVTAPKDRDTQALAARLGARLHITEAWYAHGHAFDKAAALDEALGITSRGNLGPPAMGERCLVADADVYPFGHLPADRLRPGAIYGCARYLCATAADLEAHRGGQTKRGALPLMLPRDRGMDAPAIVRGANKSTIRKAAKACLGYFQLFRYYPGQALGSFKTAGKYDLVFRGSFAHKVGLLDFYVLHLGDPCRANWRGRVLPRWGGVSA